MPFKRKPISKNLLPFHNMPPLYHTLPDHKYNAADSEVLQWIASETKLLEYLLCTASQKGLVKYDKDTGQWMGVGSE